MGTIPDDALADPKRLIADFEDCLGECRAERDEALARQTASAELLQIANSSPGDLADLPLSKELA
jgi:hypothetical protein